MRFQSACALALAAGLFLSGQNRAWALCILPNQLTNGQLADATQVMANYNAILTCLSNTTPAGSTNALQYNAGAGVFGGIGPLNNGQIIIGATGGVPQAQTLTAGPGITITNAAGNITITSSGSGRGLFSPVLSATPTSASTGLTNWLNQGSASVSDTAVGLSINAPSSGGAANVTGRYMSSPAAPYTITALIAATRSSNSFNGVGIGWYDGSSKLHLLSYVTNNGGGPIFEIEKWSSVTSFLANDFASANNAFSQPIWLQIQDDGVNVSFAFSQDGANFLALFSVAKSSGFLGSAGYSNIIFFVNPPGSQTYGTLMSWAQN